MSSAAWLQRHTLTVLSRERRNVAVTLLFGFSVFMALMLGWVEAEKSGTIHTAAAHFLAQSGVSTTWGRHIPSSSTVLLHHLKTSIVVLGAIAAILIGHRSLESDRAAGLLPLIGLRVFDSLTYAVAKVSVLGFILLGYIVFTGVISVSLLVLLPIAPLTPFDLARMAAFLMLGWFYMMVFGCISIAATATAGRASTGIIIPIALWGMWTFLLPAITGSTMPETLLDPHSGEYVAKPTPLFQWSRSLLGPLSFADAFSHLSSELLGDQYSGLPPKGNVPPIIVCIFVAALSFSAALRGCIRMDPLAISVGK
ncbi:hypothetical protein SAMN05877809_11168 [Rhodobacter sp. JA431]|uniref:hypothetical protein n=1 Tax=Rhodobacter sp. JA431 TaxID=570013 RepID=UPI000BD5AA01|nr:hypothetical protein [Rhodobacter sp. JA431]SOC20174.1 hypothetical protein SAMN05877809_11168 [Rhodobacter sp. JA431]